MTSAESKYTKAQSLLFVLISYTICLAAGYYSLPFFHGQHPLWQLFWADVIATSVIFITSLVFRNSSMYDPYWSVIPPFIALYWILNAPDDANPLRQFIVLALVTLWGMRLTLNWVRGWRGLKHEDWRYEDIAEKTGKFYWLSSFFGIHLFPTILVYLGCLPLYVILQNTAPLGMFDVLAMLITFSAILIETLADEQLKSFKRKNGKGLMRTGIWAYSRHPNYFGEITFWVGLFVFVLQTNIQENWWSSIGIISMIILFVFISVPMMDKHHLHKRPEYEHYLKEVSALVPLPPKRS